MANSSKRVCSIGEVEVQAVGLDAGLREPVGTKQADRLAGAFQARDLLAVALDGEAGLLLDLAALTPFADTVALKLAV